MFTILYGNLDFVCFYYVKQIAGRNNYIDRYKTVRETFIIRDSNPGQTRSRFTFVTLTFDESKKWNVTCSPKRQRKHASTSPFVECIFVCLQSRGILICFPSFWEGWFRVTRDGTDARMRQLFDNTSTKLAYDITRSSFLLSKKLNLSSFRSLFVAIRLDLNSISLRERRSRLERLIIGERRGIILGWFLRSERESRIVRFRRCREREGGDENGGAREKGNETIATLYKMAVKVKRLKRLMGFDEYIPGCGGGSAFYADVSRVRVGWKCGIDFYR